MTSVCAAPVQPVASAIGRHFTASAEVLRLGGRVGTAQMRLVDDADRLIATGAGAYMLS